jgi:hypothetical protein
MKQPELETLSLRGQKRTFPILFAADKCVLRNSNEHPRDISEQEPKVKLNNKEIKLNVKQLSTVKVLCFSVYVLAFVEWLFSASVFLTQ